MAESEEISRLKRSFHEHIQLILPVLRRATEHRSCSVDTLDSVMLRLEQMIIHFLSIVHLLPVVGESVLRCLHQTCESIEEALEISKGSIESFSVSAVQQSNPLRGLPKFDIKRGQLCYFVDMGFTVASMADMLGVSTRTIEGRLHASGLSIRDSYSTMSNSDLHRKLRP